MSSTAKRKRDAAAASAASGGASTAAAAIAGSRYGEVAASARDISMFNARNSSNSTKDSAGNPPSASAAAVTDTFDRYSKSGSSASAFHASARDTRDLIERTRGIFTDEIRTLMYAHGDDKDSDPAAVSLLEDIAIEFIVDMCINAARVTVGRNRVKLDDFKFLLRHDPRKLARVEEMIRMSAKLESLRKHNDLRELAKFSEDQPTLAANTTTSAAVAATAAAAAGAAGKGDTLGDDDLDDELVPLDGRMFDDGADAALAMLSGGAQAGLGALEGLDESNILNALGVL
ncbi:hypothetical protein RI367_002516 [Sorochytrium milnesiophthora]